MIVLRINNIAIHNMFTFQKLDTQVEIKTFNLSRPHFYLVFVAQLSLYDFHTTHKKYTMKGDDIYLFITPANFVCSFEEKNDKRHFISQILMGIKT